MKNKVLLIMAIALSISACTTNNNQSTNAIDESQDVEYIGKHNITVPDGKMTPEVLWAFGRLSDIQISPDKQTILYGVSYYSIEQNKSNRELFTISTNGENNTQITHTKKGEFNAKWVKNGTKIAFLSASSGSMQLWEMNPDGSDRQQISNYEGGIADYLYSPDNQKVILIANVKSKPNTSDVYPDLDKTSGIIVEDLMYKHWDEWVTTVPHPILFDYDGAKLSNEKDILEGELFECPVKPFGGVEQIAFSPDNKYIAYTSKKMVGKDYALSTNTDIYLYDIVAQKTIKNLTDGMMGYDMNPVFSPDGKKLAWESMEHDGYESDKNRLYVMNMETMEREDISINFDQNSSCLQWDNEGKNIYMISCWHGTTQVYKVDIATKSFKQITDGVHDYEQIALGNNTIIGVKHSMSMPNEIYTINESDGLETQITFENQHILSQMEMGKVEGRWITTTDNKKMLVWVIYPPKFDSNKQYPTLLYCQGGPQSPVSQFWSYRWNFQIMAANDYIIVAPNRRGLVGFGQEWLEEISKDYGGQCMRDYFTAIDSVSTEPYVNKEKLGCVGASFGGYSVYWMAGHHEKRFKAFIAHDGMFNLEQQYLETEEMFFVNWDLGGAYWDANTKTTYDNSPHKFVDKWDTPIMIIHGEKDYRILASQGMSAFNAAQLRGIPSELLIFPDENHWVLQPQNGILWQRRFFNWLDKWLK